MKISNRVSKPLLTLFLSISTLVGSASAAEGMEARRIAQNADCLLKMSPVMRPKEMASLSDMEKNGYKPIINLGVWRTPADQMKKYRAGVSKVTYSFHNATTKTGHPDSLAADITDQRWGWTGLAPRRYWLTLARVAWNHNLYSGAHFGLTSAQKKTFDRAMDTSNFASYSGPIGWDAAHLEPRGITTAQAKAGKRPYSK